MANERTLYNWSPIPADNLEGAVLAINQALENVSISTRELNQPQIPLLYNEPSKYVDGQLYRADGTNWNPTGEGRGVYLYDDILGWIKIG